jgi:hypothetical protein
VAQAAPGVGLAPMQVLRIGMRVDLGRRDLVLVRRNAEVRGMQGDRRVAVGLGHKVQVVIAVAGSLSTIRLPFC